MQISKKSKDKVILTMIWAMIKEGGAKFFKHGYNGGDGKFVLEMGREEARNGEGVVL